jgi:pantetheine-phosphate adenylyltransferase
MKKALYCGSFDPVTYGHMDIIKRASKMFSQVTVAVGENPNKKYMFSVAQRLNMLATAKELIGADNVVIEGAGIRYLTADYARMFGYHVIIKGVRTNQDFDYEKLIHEVSLTQQHNIETVLLFSSNKLGHVSSSAVKELARYQGLIHEYVPIHVKAAIEQKQGQRIIGVTGTIGSGKSTLCKRLGHTHVNMDAIAHQLYESETPMAVETRRIIKETFGTINRKEIGEIVFNNPDELKKLNAIYKEPLLTMIRHKLATATGPIILEGALLVEMDWLFLCNNRVIIVKTPSQEEHERRLLSRGYSKEQITRRINSQYSYEQKLAGIEDRIKKDMFGNYRVVDSELTDLQEYEESFKLSNYITDHGNDSRIGQIVYS